jgi:hypothetical protein
MNILKYFLVFIFFLSSLLSFAQDDDLLGMLEDEVPDEPMELVATFKSTHIINSHTIERMKKQQLDFRINHRFGEINSGYENFWGLDNALISLDFGYGINDWLMVGLRRSTFNSTVDGSLKFSILRQTKGAKNIPVSLSYYTNLAADGTIGVEKQLDTNFYNRLSFTHQLLIARKFNDKLSLQLMPTYVHRNLVDYDEENDIIAVGFGGRYKITRRLSLTGEYFWASHTASNNKYYNPLSVGIDIETGGHVFQFFISNTRMMEESGFISQTTESWSDGSLFFGFNISRVFAIGKVKH